ncbi:MAG: hypothetical protein QOJ69_314 [Actinomycetota bacterium]|nr:hypothetical protein [Actinomycetota bacterium]
MTVFERFTTGARQAVTEAQGEARRLGHHYIGTEHILLGLLAVGDGIAADVLRDAGIDAATVERDVVRIVGPGRAGLGPGLGVGIVDADADALRVLGIDLDAVRDAVEATFGPGALDLAQVSVTGSRRRRFGRRGIGRRGFGRRGFGRRGFGRRRACGARRPGWEGPPAFAGGHISFTPRSKKVLELSLREALALRHGHIGTEHILLGIIREGEGLAAEILVLHGVGLDDLRRRVLSALDDAA